MSHILFIQQFCMLHAFISLYMMHIKHPAVFDHTYKSPPQQSRSGTVVSRWASLLLLESFEVRHGTRRSLSGQASQQKEMITATTTTTTTTVTTTVTISTNNNNIPTEAPKQEYPNSSHGPKYHAFPKIVDVPFLWVTGTMNH